MSTVEVLFDADGPEVAFSRSSLRVAVRPIGSEGLNLVCGDSELAIPDLVIRLKQPPSFVQQIGIRQYVAGLNWRLQAEGWDLERTSVGVTAVLKGFLSVSTELVGRPVAIRAGFASALLVIDGSSALRVSAGLSFREQRCLSEGEALVATGLMLYQSFSSAVGVPGMLARFLGLGPEQALETCPNLAERYAISARVERKRRRFTTVAGT